jgi:hypothetical protein
MEIIFDSLAGQICMKCALEDCRMCPKAHEVKAAEEMDERAIRLAKKRQA